MVQRQWRTLSGGFTGDSSSKCLAKSWSYGMITSGGGLHSEVCLIGDGVQGSIPSRS